MAQVQVVDARLRRVLRPWARTSRKDEGRTVAASTTGRVMAPTTKLHFHALRLGFIAVLLWSVVFSPKTMVIGPDLLALGALVYAGVILLSELARRTIASVTSPMVALMLVADGLFLSWILYVSGGTLSPLRFLIYIHLIAVTLTYNSRAGIAAAFVHSILLFVVFRTPTMTEMDLPPGAIAPNVGEEDMSLYQSWIFNTLIFWLITLATAPFSSLNERELRRRRSDLGVLAAMADELEDLDDPVDIAEASLRRVCHAFDFGRATVLAIHNDQLVSMASRGLEGELTPSLRVDALVDRAWDEQEALLVARLDDKKDPLLAELFPGGRNLLVVPMFADGQPLGVLVLESANQDEPVIQRRVISMVMQCASHAALAMRKAWLLQQVQVLADTDALTGLANRRSFEKALSQDISRSIRTGEEFTLVMLDLDHFKTLNDRFGHQAGDDVLRKVGEVLRTACRESDTPARYGGEEFAVLMPSCGKSEAFQTAERLRELIANIEAPVPVTTSAGVAIYPLHAPDGQHIIEAADEALYESKAMGRNRSRVSARRVLQAVDV
ncbi:MAG: GGDEF domain-containing protein [Actinomycetota bacterium]|nr:GGDEF domain-containing protein [Actinomycetota bacterium]